MKSSGPVRFARACALLGAFVALPSLAATPLIVPYTGAVPKAEKKDFASSSRVKLNMGELESLKAGDVVDFTVPNGKTYAVVFESLESKGNGIKSWVGYLRDTPDHLRVILTTGPGGTFGTILTPDGEFRLVPGEGHDWLVDMKAERSNMPPIDLRKDILRAPHPPAPMPKVSPSGDAASATTATTAAGITATPKAGSLYTIDVMVAYSAGYASSLGANLNTRIQQLFTSANTYLADSQVNIRLRLVKTVQVNYSDSGAPNDNDTVLKCITPINGTNGNAPCDPVFANLETLRAQYGADLVSFLRSNSANGLNDSYGGAGIAWAPNSALQPGWKPYMYSVVTGCTASCDFVWAHELGHNMGNMHDRATVEWQAGGTATLGQFDVGATPYAYGYYACDAGPAGLNCNPTIANGSPGSCSDQPQCSTGIYNGSTVTSPGQGTNNISDIMAYFQYSTTKNLVFSNPRLNCSGAVGFSTPCGVPDSPNSTTSADTARSMNEQAAAVSQMLPTVVPMVVPKAHTDFDANGKGDLLWVNGSNALAMSLMNGTTPTNSTPSGGTGYVVKLLGDFDGDGKTDILYRGSDGSYKIQLMNGSAVKSEAVILAGGSGWEVMTKGDFNGDGKTDLLWKAPNGQYGMWLMNGTSAAGAGLFDAPGIGWDVQLVADFGGDGMSDILWRNTDGRITEWAMNGANTTGQVLMTSYQNLWMPLYAGDFDGDGKADIVWSYPDGSIAVWLVDGTTVRSATVLAAGNTGWSVKMVGDLDGDGKADIVLQNTSGTVGAWLMNGSSIRATGTFGPAGYSPVTIDDFDGDGKADIVWKDSAGNHQVTLMNGTSVTASGALFAAGSGWSVIRNDH